MKTKSHNKMAEILILTYGNRSWMDKIKMKLLLTNNPAVTKKIQILLGYFQYCQVFVCVGVI